MNKGTTQESYNVYCDHCCERNKCGTNIESIKVKRHLLRLLQKHLQRKWKCERWNVASPGESGGKTISETGTRTSPKTGKKLPFSRN